MLLLKDFKVESLVLVEDEIAQAEQVLESIKEKVVHVARAYLMEVADDPGEQLRRANQLYWHHLNVPVSLIAEVLTGKPSAPKLLEMLDGMPSNITCCECGADIVLRSRAHLAELLHWQLRAIRRNFAADLRCDPCKVKRNQDISEDWIAEQRERTTRIEALASMPYREYLVTPEWLEKRSAKLRQAHYRCQLCNAGGLLNVHHRTYERRGNENMADLIVLCHPCHAKFHDKIPKSSPSTGDFRKIFEEMKADGSLS